MRTTDAAKEIRTALKTAFPGVKFSVRSGSSINIGWTDGPTSKQVAQYAGKYESISRDERSGEILCGGNTFVFYTRDLSARVLAFAAKQVPSNAVGHEIEYWTNRATSCVQVLASGQLLQWDEYSVGRIARDAARRPALSLVSAGQ